MHYSKYSKSEQNMLIHYMLISESLRVVNSLQIVNSLRVVFLLCRGSLGTPYRAILFEGGWRSPKISTIYTTNLYRDAFLEVLGSGVIGTLPIPGGPLQGHYAPLSRAMRAVRKIPSKISGSERGVFGKRGLFSKVHFL